MAGPLFAFQEKNLAKNFVQKRCLNFHHFGIKFPFERMDIGYADNFNVDSRWILAVIFQTVRYQVFASTSRIFQS